MITTVTTSTITTVTTIAALGLPFGITIVALFSLIAFLLVKELVGAGLFAPSQRIARSLNVSILPLAMVFVVLIAVKLAEYII